MSQQEHESGIRRQSGAPEDTVIVHANAPDQMLARRIVHTLLEEGHIACAHMGASGTSAYVWQGKLEGGDEVPLSFKTAAACLPALYQRFCELHPDTVPQFLVTGVVAGSSAYLDWVVQSTLAKTNPSA